MEDSLLELFVCVDDFWQMLQPVWYQHLLQERVVKRIRPTQLCESEIMTILIGFHDSGYRTFKDYYTRHVAVYWHQDFPNLVSYERFVQLIPRVGIPLFVYLNLSLSTCSGISFVDSTPLKVCHTRRIYQHKVFAGWAERGKTSMGWFFGFKLHLVVSQHGELLAFHLTPGNVDDRQPLPEFADRLFGKLFGDKGYLSAPLAASLYEKGVELITTLRRNMQPKLLPLRDKLWLRQRAVVESVNNVLKNRHYIEHTRHRSVNNFFVHLMAGLVAYCHHPKKPSVALSSQELNRLAAAI